MKEKQVLFRVIMGVGGHEYVIYTDGQVEGFGDGAVINNYYRARIWSAVEADRCQRSTANSISRSPELTTDSPTDDLSGAAHSTPR
jgi:hypothetical protein